MSLTGTSFWVVLIIVTLLMVIGTMLLWARIPGPRLVRALTRLVMILLCQLTAISVVAVWMNNSYGLYSSWDDLLGTPTTATPSRCPARP
ncbi:hypothetical protein [Streptomyces sp. SID12488]|uniref:hypothetical protein n=1 Tax=Streptomyces sp. SID12488 TaxID=2706040 RepID=UPI001EF2CD18|nr:hypothetical protein [Streptomyces sp. SID12488]